MPFDTESSKPFLMTHVLLAPVELSKRVPHIDPTLARTVMDCLHSTPADRPTASDVADVLSSIADRSGIPPLEALDLMGRTTH